MGRLSAVVNDAPDQYEHSLGLRPSGVPGGAGRQRGCSCMSARQGPLPGSPTLAEEPARHSRARGMTVDARFTVDLVQTLAAHERVCIRPVLRPVTDTLTGDR